VKKKATEIFHTGDVTRLKNQEEGGGIKEGKFKLPLVERGFSF